MSHIEIKIVADSAADMSALVAQLSSQLSEKITAPALAAEPKAAKPAKAKTDKPSPEKEPEPQPEPEAQAEDVPAVDYAAVQKAVTGLAAKKGRDAVLEVFGPFGVTHGTGLKSEQWAEAIAALNAAAEG